MYNLYFSAAIISIGLAASNNAYAFFLDGNGHFGLIGETRIAPDFQKDHGTYQATRISFDLNGEVKANDRASFNLRLGLTDDPSGFYLGDTPRPKTCEPRQSSTDPTKTDSSCDGRNQSPIDTGYKSYTPVIREAYAKYAFNYCLLTAGRRSRELGLGAYLSAGKNPFDTDASVFDGVTCDVNIQKHQDLGFSFGFDKLQETGTWIDNPYDNSTVYDTDSTRKNSFNSRSRTFGANNASDDMDQIFFGITYDDLKTKGPNSFAKQVGLYFSNILSSDSSTDVKFFDLYTGFYAGNFVLKNELIFRVGKTADPSITAMGGKRTQDYSDPVVNNVNSVALAGNIEYTISKSGASIGPEEFNEGNLRRHVLFSDYAYAPGDSDGYFQNRSLDKSQHTDTSAVGEDNRDSHATALALNRNYHPAILFFNGRRTSRQYGLGGVYDPERVMNASLYTLGYRYENMEAGNFEVKAISGRLIQTVPSDVKKYYDNQSATNYRPVGYYSQDLGYELDLNYSYRYQKEVELGLGLAAALPGKAWKTSSVDSPQMGLGLQGSFAIKF
jgi:hypothetical protein